MNKMLKRAWMEERNEVIKTLDVQKFKEFWQKWSAKGFYRGGLPCDQVIEISLRKMLYNLKSATDEEKEKAKKWLEERGCDTEM